MRYEEFRKKLAYIIGREHQFDFTVEEEEKLKDLYEDVVEDSKHEGFNGSWSDCCGNGF